MRPNYDHRRTEHSSCYVGYPLEKCRPRQASHCIIHYRQRHSLLTPLPDFRGRDCCDARSRSSALTKLYLFAATDATIPKSTAADDSQCASDIGFHFILIEGRVGVMMKRRGVRVDVVQLLVKCPERMVGVAVDDAQHVA